jgi:hypothetical protein
MRKEERLLVKQIETLQQYFDYKEERLKQVKKFVFCKRNISCRLSNFISKYMRKNVYPNKLYAKGHEFYYNTNKSLIDLIEFLISEYGECTGFSYKQR